MSGIGYFQTGARFGAETGGSISIPANTTVYVNGTQQIAGDITVDGVSNLGGVLSTNSYIYSKVATGGGVHMVFQPATGSQNPRIQSSSVAIPIDAFSGSTITSNRFEISSAAGVNGTKGPGVFWIESLPISTSSSNFQVGISPIIRPGNTLSTSFRYRVLSLTPTVDIVSPYVNEVVGLLYKPILTSTNGSKHYFIWAQSGDVRIVSLASGTTSQTMDGTVKRLIVDSDGDIGTQDNVPIAGSSVPSSSSDPSGVDGEIRYGTGVIYIKTSGTWYRFTGSTF